jgi:hypothetical protein
VTKDKGLKLTKQIRDQGYNDNILRVNSALSGEKASDSNSFIKRLLK